VIQSFSLFFFRSDDPTFYLICNLIGQFLKSADKLILGCSIAIMQCVYRYLIGLLGFASFVLAANRK